MIIIIIILLIIDNYDENNNIDARVSVSMIFPIRL